jgi:hypothetical protein
MNFRVLNNTYSLFITPSESNHSCKECNENLPEAVHLRIAMSGEECKVTLAKAATTDSIHLNIDQLIAF